MELQIDTFHFQLLSYEKFTADILQPFYYIEKLRLSSFLIR